MGGHNRKPTSQHVSEGTFRADRHANRVDALSVSGVPNEPEGLNAAQRALWQIVLDTLPTGCLGEVDTTALVELVEVYQLMRDARGQLATDACDRNARLAYTAYFDRFHRLSREFGLTPLSRAAIKVPIAPDDEEDPMQMILERFQRSV